jgi:hypothetical protein
VKLTETIPSWTPPRWSSAEVRDRRDTGDGHDIDIDRVERCERIGYPSVPSPSIGLFRFAVAAADISGDGKVDAVIANEGSDTVSVLFGDVVVADGGSDTISVLLGNGDGTFQPKVDCPTGSEPVSVVVADVSGC